MHLSYPKALNLLAASYKVLYPQGNSNPRRLREREVS